jgi:hypothetical protein
VGSEMKETTSTVNCENPAEAHMDSVRPENWKSSGEVVK